MTRIEDRADDELLHDLGGRDHPSFLFLDAQGEVLARHDAEDPSVKAFEETGARVARSLELRKKAEAGDEASKVDLALVQCELGVLELSDAESAIEGRNLAPEQEKALGTLRADARVSDLSEMLRKSRDGAARRLAAEEFMALYKAGTHPARLGNRRVYWSVLAEEAAGTKDVAMIKAMLEGLRAAAGAQPPERLDRQVKDIEAWLRELEAAK